MLLEPESFGLHLVLGHGVGVIGRRVEIGRALQQRHDLLQRQAATNHPVHLLDGGQVVDERVLGHRAAFKGQHALLQTQVSTKTELWLRTRNKT